jgi:hypothetical protein
LTFFNGEVGVTIDLKDYINSTIEDFPINFGTTTAPTSASEALFIIDKSPVLDKKMAKLFHTFVAKGLFACKRARPDIDTTIAFLCTRVNVPTEAGLNQLLRLIKYLNGTRGKGLFLAADDPHVVT